MPTLGHGKICHVELPTTDLEASIAFYRDLFGWRMRRHAGTALFDDAVDEVSGHFVTRDPAAPGVLFSIWVDDLGEAIDAVTAAGCDIVQPAGGDPGELTAHFRDPGGNVVGLYQEPVETG